MHSHTIINNVSTRAQLLARVDTYRPKSYENAQPNLLRSNNIIGYESLR
ncbi:hypothetical protein [Spirosoma flavus]